MIAYLTKDFGRFARKASLADSQLIQAALDVTEGRFDADLGGGVFKQRVARQGGGKSGGFRTIILFKVGGHCFFAFGFAKKDKANVSAKELKALKRLADIFLGYSDVEIQMAETAGELIKVVNDGDAEKKS